MITQLIIDNGTVLAFSVLFFIAVFFISREIYCWYFKINESNDLLRKNNQILSEMLYEIKNKKTNER